MTTDRLSQILKIGETVAVEFKKCSGNIESDVYETVCSFSNRFGGDIFLGVNDDGSIEGVSPKAAPELIKNFISVLSNPLIFSPTIYLEPEIIEYENKSIIHIYVPTSGEVHSFKKVIYDRANDSDIKVTSSAQIAQMY
ncbi:MAG: putative DNA binding domain-containing protein, partial [Spirochaetales bacterium]|nr:putative DNA binding domain-containing protein [Spirochaetales bacterium]